MALQQQQHLAPVGQQHTSLHSAFHNHNLRRTSVFHRKRRLHVCLATAAGAGVGDSSEQPSSSAAPSHSSLPPEKPGGPLQWLRQRFSSSKIDKQKLAEYGLGGLLLAVLTMHAGLLSLGQARHDHALPAGAFAAYGIISNLNAGVLVTMSWLTVVKQTGLTPLDPGMWPRFLGIYAGLYVAIGSILRPFRLTAALAAAPLFNSALDKLQHALRINKAVAFGIMLAAIAVSSFTLIACMLVVAGGFPNGPPPLPWRH